MLFFCLPFLYLVVVVDRHVSWSRPDLRTWMNWGCLRIQCSDRRVRELKVTEDQRELHTQKVRYLCSSPFVNREGSVHCDVQHVWGKWDMCTKFLFWKPHAQNGKKVSGGRWTLHEWLHNLHCLPNGAEMIKWEGMRWAENVACVEEKRNGNIIFLRKLKFRCKWNSSIKVSFKELTCEDVGLILLD